MSTKTCTKCGKTKPVAEFHKGKRYTSRICNECKEKSNQKVCTKCNQLKPITEFRKHGYQTSRHCNECVEKYEKTLYLEKTCTKCGETKPVTDFYKKGNGFDSDCKICKLKYQKDYYRNHADTRLEYGKKHYQDNKQTYLETNRRYTGAQSMDQNKHCPSYLGVVIGERLCRHIFQNVEVMPNGNPGFDIICNRNYKIDVKTACLSKANKKYYQWMFSIKKNKIADYFLFIAFDDRQHLNPLHMWLIPGKEINHRPKISVYPDKTDKLSDWERSSEELRMCCDILKETEVQS